MLIFKLNLPWLGSSNASWEITNNHMYFCNLPLYTWNYSLYFLNAEQKIQKNIIHYQLLKGIWHEIFDLSFFSWISVPQAPKYSIGAVLNFFENSRRYSRINVYHRCKRHRRKAVQQCQRHWRKIVRRCRWHRRLVLVTDFQWSPVSLKPAINLSPVTRTRTLWRWGAAKDRKKLKGINRRYQRPLRPPKLNNAILVWSSFGGLRGLRACEGPLRLFMAVPMTISAAVDDFGGRS